ncbi:hypothetical protein H6G17_31410 [Chroococcidiopsis sp. FACHB-1243]|nr:hypothetical protein [Chroococcidiopsis sp. [FACHB-1243]]MBD2309918.1 hypothetical protein [Chroococcidiopsis sp. [FACHB-1243]]
MPLSQKAKSVGFGCPATFYFFFPNCYAFVLLFACLTSTGLGFFFLDFGSSIARQLGGRQLSQYNGLGPYVSLSVGWLHC